MGGQGPRRAGLQRRGVTEGHPGSVAGPRMRRPCRMGSSCWARARAPRPPARLYERHRSSRQTVLPPCGAAQRDRSPRDAARRQNTLSEQQLDERDRLVMEALRRGEVDGHPQRCHALQLLIHVVACSQAAVQLARVKLGARLVGSTGRNPGEVGKSREC
eukprot:scaffold1434_cov184-Prasinococcus_capsulatus_cf.AAC.2